MKFCSFLPNNPKFMQCVSETSTKVCGEHQMQSRINSLFLLSFTIGVIYLLKDLQKRLK